MRQSMVEDGLAAQNDYLELRRKANWVRRTVLDMAVRSSSGHVTTAFSLAELFSALYGGILRFDPNNLQWPGRDRFILSEGQAGLGLYPVLADAGFFPKDELKNFVQEGSRLGVHSEPGVPGIQVLTGSLGHGLPIATGMADAGKIDGASWLVFCLTGDGELCEGSNWEALITAHTLRLNNLVVIVNRNHQFTIGRTDGRFTQRDVALDPLAEKFQAFGLETRTIDGHSFRSIFEGFADVRERARASEKPLCFIAETVKGKGGGPRIEDQRDWHYRVPEGADLKSVRETLDAEAVLLAEER
jgi:transketolase